MDGTEEKLKEFAVEIRNASATFEILQSKAMHKALSSKTLSLDATKDLRQYADRLIEGLEQVVELAKGSDVEACEFLSAAFLGPASEIDNAAYVDAAVEINRVIRSLREPLAETTPIDGRDKLEKKNIVSTLEQFVRHLMETVSPGAMSAEKVIEEFHERYIGGCKTTLHKIRKENPDIKEWLTRATTSAPTTFREADSYGGSVDPAVDPEPYVDPDELKKAEEWWQSYFNTLPSKDRPEVGEWWDKLSDADKIEYWEDKREKKKCSRNL